MTPKNDAKKWRQICLERASLLIPQGSTWSKGRLQCSVGNVHSVCADFPAMFQLLFAIFSSLQADIFQVLIDLPFILRIPCFFQGLLDSTVDEMK